MYCSYLEIVTPEPDAVCATYARIHGTVFSDPVPELGEARVTTLRDGGKLGIRAPMHESEAPITRPYLLVEDAQRAIGAAEAAGAEIAHPPLTIPGVGTFAIFIQGGIHHGLWQE